MGTRYMFGRKNVTACRFLLIVSGVTLLLVGLIIRNIHEESRLQHHVRENILASDVISETEAEQQLTRLSSLLTKFSTDKQTALIHKFQASLNSSWVLAHQPPTRNGTRDMLPGTMVHPSAWVKYNIKWRGLTLPVLTCEPLGRLGNVMGEYATLYALAHIYNVSVVIHPKMKNQLQDHFPYTSLPDLPGNYTPNKWRQLSKIGSLYNYALVEVAASGLLGPHTFIIKEYPFEIQLFNQFKKDLQREFTFAPEYTARAQLFLLNITEERRKEELDPIFIGFHIRQTDYAQHVKKMFDASLPHEVYYHRAIQYYQNKFPGKAVFIVASDDTVYAKSKLKNYKDVIFSPGTSAIEDLAILSSCNHSIVTMGSYGFWSAYLTGGEVVYPDVLLKKEYRFSRHTYEKIGMKSFTPLQPN